MRLKYFSAEDARRLVAGEVNEVVVSDNTTIVYNCNQFLCVENGREYNCDVPHSYITDGDYDAIAKDIRTNSIYPWIEFETDIVSILKIDNSILTTIKKGEIKKIDIHCNPSGYGEESDAIKCGELFCEKDTRVCVVRICKTNDEYELGGNIMETLTEIFHMWYPIDDGEYIELEEYIGRAWHQNNFNFEVIDIEGNTWYSCNKDKDGKILPIMDWHIGNSDRKLKKSIRDEVSDYYGLIETGHILNSMLIQLMMDIGA
jgi:hypothetical protein